MAARASRFLPPVLVTLTVGITLLGLNNVFGDSKPIEALASQAACAGEGPKCQPRQRYMMRSPFMHEFGWIVAGRNRDVRCMRALMFVGDWACKVK